MPCSRLHGESCGVIVPFSRQYLSAGHASQPERPSSSWYVPSGQSIGAVAPSAQLAPLWQLMQDTGEAPCVAGLKEPPAHRVALMLPEGQ